MHRGPRPSLAIFDPLEAVDISRLPPLPSTPPPAQTIAVVAPSLYPIDGEENADDCQTRSRDLIGWTPMFKGPLVHRQEENVERHTTFDGERLMIDSLGKGKLVDIATPMPAGRTLPPPSLPGNVLEPGNDNTAVRPLVIVEEYTGIDKDTFNTVASLASDSIQSPVREESPESGWPSTLEMQVSSPMGTSAIQQVEEIPSVDVHEVNMNEKSPTTTSTIPPSIMVSAISVNPDSVLLEQEPSPPVSRSSASNETPLAASISTPSMTGNESLLIPPRRITMTTNSSLPVVDQHHFQPDLESQGGDTTFPMNDAESSRLPILFPPGSDQANATLSAGLGDATNLMDDDKSFMNAMMMPSLSDATAMMVEEETQEGTRRSGKENFCETPPTTTTVKGTGKGRAMDRVTLPRIAAHAEAVRKEEGPSMQGDGMGGAGTGKHKFGSVLAGMAEYEAATLKGRPDIMAAEDGRKRRQEEELSQGGDAVLQVVLSEPSGAPFVFCDPTGRNVGPSVLPLFPGLSPSKSSHLHSETYTMSTTAAIRSNDLLSVPGSNQTSTAAAGDISTLFPSSPSIKKYMNAQRAQVRRAGKQAGSSSSDLMSSGVEMHNANNDDDASRLNLGDLSDLCAEKMDDRFSNREAEDTILLNTSTTQTFHPHNHSHHPAHHHHADRSTIYPSSPAVKRNMAQDYMLVDLVRDVIALEDLETLDRTLEQSVCVRESAGQGASGKAAAVAIAGSASGRHVATSSSSLSLTATRQTGTSLSANEIERVTCRAPDGEKDIGDQTLDIGALIKKTSRKLTSDMIAESTFCAPSLGLGFSGADDRGRGDMSMLLDTKSPFKPTGRLDMSSSVFGNRRTKGKLLASVGDDDESYYDLLASDDTFMKEVGDMTIGGDTLMFSPTKGNILPPALLNRAASAASSQMAHEDFQFKIPELPRGLLPNRASNSAASTRIPPSSPTRSSHALPHHPTHLSPVRTTITPAHNLPPFPARTDNGGRTFHTSKFIPSSATRTSATPNPTVGTDYKRPLGLDYRSTTILPPRTPLAERGYGPQSAKKASASSLATVLSEADGRSLNVRNPTKGLATPKDSTVLKRSATLSDFSPIKHRATDDDEVKRTATKQRNPSDHTRTRSDVAVSNRPAGDHEASATDAHKLPSTMIHSSPSRISRVPGTTTALARPSQIRLPGQGLRQVSGQQEAENPDSRSRKQAMSPDKLLKGMSLTRTDGITRRATSPPGIRSAGFKPTPSQRDGTTQGTDKPTGRERLGMPSRSKPSVIVPPPSRSGGSNASTATARSSYLPPRTSASSSSSSVVPRLSSQTTTRPLSVNIAGGRISAVVPAASLAGRTSTGLPRPTTAGLMAARRLGSNMGSSATAAVIRPGSTTSVASNGRVTHSVSRSRTAAAFSAGEAIMFGSGKVGVVPPKRGTADGREKLERPRQRPM
ncbi:hypothetical protein QFC19_008186 [Naganishia cerealis]|uniref:Uncharacterized protein n=1 Tax=Naganishia cerealis TaxID=610337 RepID=A0ACC2V4A0_9TREE|nr:hypothetical protein QFC19_008186 [Naganishia cerealis]